MTVNEMDPGSALALIQRLVNRIIPNCQIDREQVALDLFLELKEKNLRPLWCFVHARCVDAIRKHTRYKHHVKQTVIETKLYHSEEHTSFESSDRDDVVSDRLQRLNKFLGTDKLPHKHKRIIFLRYYQDQTLEQISSEVHMSVDSVSETIISILRTIHQEIQGAQE